MKNNETGKKDEAKKEHLKIQRILEQKQVK